MLAPLERLPVLVHLQINIHTQSDNALQLVTNPVVQQLIKVIVGIATAAITHVRSYREM